MRISSFSRLSDKIDKVKDVIPQHSRLYLLIAVLEFLVAFIGFVKNFYLY